MASEKEQGSEVTEQIRKIYQSEHLSEEEKDRLISELLQQATPQANRERLNPAGGYIISLLLPPLGFLIGGHYLLHHKEEGVKSGVICMVLTTVSLLSSFLLFRIFLKALVK